MCAKGAGETFGGADELRGKGARADTDQDAFIGGPGLGDVMDPAEITHLGIDALGSAAERQFAQRDEIAAVEKMSKGLFGLLSLVNFALAQPLDELIRRNVDEFDFVSFVEDFIG